MDILEKKLLLVKVYLEMLLQAISPNAVAPLSVLE